MSTVIKAGQVGVILNRLSTVDLADHLAEAHAVIEAAKREAARITAEAKIQARNLHEEFKKAGHKEGYARGYDEGTQTGRKDAFDEAMKGFEREHVGIVDAMKEAVDRIDALKGDLALAARTDLLDFAVRVAGKLTFAIGSLHRESAQGNLERALHLVSASTDVTVRVHPDDIASIEKFAGTILPHIEASDAVTIIADDTIAPGGCKVETGTTSIDATLETQVDEMVSLLTGGSTTDA